jgi:hypothetical protein
MSLTARAAMLVTTSIDFYRKILPELRRALQLLLQALRRLRTRIALALIGFSYKLFTRISKIGLTRQEYVP